MRVAISYSDGEYHMYDPSKRAFADGVNRESWMVLNTIEITDAEWEDYQSFLEVCVGWHRRMQDLEACLDARRDEAIESPLAKWRGAFSASEE